MINENVQAAFTGDKYTYIRCEFYIDEILVYEYVCKVWDAIDKATKFMSENEKPIMYFYKMSKLFFL